MALGLRVALNQKTQTSDLRPLSIMQTIKRELNEDGVLIKETWMCDGQIHRTDGPAVRCMDADGNICQETWILNNECHETCILNRHPNGKLKIEQWWVDESEDSERLQRTDGPAYQCWNDDGTLAAEEWWVDGKHHRTDGPAMQYWNADGTLSTEHWILDGKHHRTDGPAVQCWNDDGTLTTEEWFIATAEEWFLDGKHHRTDGPAVQRWNDDGTLTAEEWWVDGKKTPRRTIVLARARAKVLRSSRLLILANAVQRVSVDSLSVIGGFLK